VAALVPEFIPRRFLRNAFSHGALTVHAAYDPHNTRLVGSRNDHGTRIEMIGSLAAVRGCRRGVDGPSGGAHLEAVADKLLMAVIGLALALAAAAVVWAVLAHGLPPMWLFWAVQAVGLLAAIASHVSNAANGTMPED
jgi:hypothetical protein